MIRLALGEFADTLLTSQRVVPDKLVKAGFSFTYPDIRSAVAEIVAPPA
jgi:NAD dependent epimerase/dehydratase family enzyme